MDLLILQKRSTIVGFLFYIISIAYAFIDPANDIKELNQLVEKLTVPLFGGLHLAIVLLSAALSLIFYIFFYFLAYRNSRKAISVFICATLFAFILFISDMGPQINSGVNMIIELIACTSDGIILACLLLGRKNEEKH